jgi:hypothetical protein
MCEKHEQKTTQKKAGESVKGFCEARGLHEPNH